MLTDVQLRNFRRYIAMCPASLHGYINPLGAYDAKTGVAPRGIPSTAFARGGAFDSEVDAETSSGEDTLRIFRALASRLSPEQWAGLQECFRDDDASEETEAVDDLPTYKNGLPENAMDAALKIAPNLARITADRDSYPPTRYGHRGAFAIERDLALAAKIAPGISRIIVVG